MLSGIYKIENIINNHIYIGSCSSFNVRKGAHICLLKQNKHHSQYLQNAYNKYGKDSFNILMIESVEDKSLLLEREQYYIDTLNPEYNICRIAGSTQGRRFSEEHKQRLSNSLKGKKRTEEQKRQASLCKTGTTHTQETKDKVSKIVNDIKGKRVGDKISREEVVKVIFIINDYYEQRTIKSICLEYNYNYRSVLKILNNQTWKEYYHLILPDVINNFKNQSLTKRKQ